MKNPFYAAPQQRLEGGGRLVGRVAHDLQELFALILARSSTARRNGVPAAVDAEFAIIEDAANRGAALLRELPGFVTRHAVANRQFLLEPEVQLLLPLLRKLVGRNVRVEVCEGQPSLPVELKPGQIDQVLMILVANAADAMPDGGTVRITTGRVIRGTEGPSPQRFAVLEVSDTGHGIRPEVQARMWDPFFTTHADRGGDGIGLAAVRAIVDAAGGEVFVKSEVGVGTTFTVFLPRATKPMTIPG